MTGTRAEIAEAQLDVPIDVLPVVHVRDHDQAAAQAVVAFAAGAPGVFLIDHGGNSAIDLLRVFEEVSITHSDRFVGVNFLGLRSGLAGFRTIVDALEDGTITRAPDGLWTDDAIPEAKAALNYQIEHLNGQTRHFGGVAFKYTRAYTDDPARAAEEATRLTDMVDVVTTSGPGTGHAASPAKIRAMKDAIGDRPLALASGVDAKNIARYLGSVDFVLAATSIETASYSGGFDQEKLGALLLAARSARTT